MRRGAAKFQKLQEAKQLISDAVQREIDNDVLIRPPNSLQAFRLTNAQWETFGTKYQFSLSTVLLKVWCSSKLQAPGVPTLLTQKDLEKRAKMFAVERSKPWWLKRLVANRVQFRYRGLAVAPDEDEEDEFPAKVYVLLVMDIGNEYAHVLEATKHTVLQMMTTLAIEEMPGHFNLQTYYHNFKYMDVSAIPGLMDEDAQLQVVDVFWHGSYFVLTRRPMDFDCLYSVLPQVGRTAPNTEAASATSKEAVKHADILAVLQDEYPWLSLDDIKRYCLRMDEEEIHVPNVGARRSGSGGSGESASAQPAGPSVPIADLAEAMGARVVEELQERRAANEPDDEQDHFYFQLRGGRWTYANTGLVADSAGCLGRSHVYDWCRHYRFPTQKTFALRRYGHDTATRLAKEYVRRGNYFYNMWMFYGSDYAHVFNAGDLDSFENDMPMDDFLTWSLSLDLDDEALDRITELRNWGR